MNSLSMPLIYTLQPGYHDADMWIEQLLYKPGTINWQAAFSYSIDSDKVGACIFDVDPNVGLKVYEKFFTLKSDRMKKIVLGMPYVYQFEYDATYEPENVMVMDVINSDGTSPFFARMAVLKKIKNGAGKPASCNRRYFYMNRTTNVILNDKSSYGLRAQEKLGQYDFPFTLNPVIGCFMGCKYCFSPGVAYQYKTQQRGRELFFTNAIVQLDKDKHLDKELKRYSVLPQHMKRVQVNEISEYYQPQVINNLQSNDQVDLMAEILNVFKRHYDNGNCWMVHILTKSHLILNHLDILKDMKEQVQVEISFATHDDKISRSLEFYTPDVTKRLEVIEKLSDTGIFVRVMAMPFYGDKKNLLKLKTETFKRGAKAFKNKGLNYFKDWDELRQDMTFDEFLKANLSTGKGRVDEKDESLIIKSGEYALNENGNQRYKTVLVPRMDENFKAIGQWGAVSLMDERFERRRMKMIDYDYSLCNDIDWGYII